MPAMGNSEKIEEIRAGGSTSWVRTCDKVAADTIAVASGPFSIMQSHLLTPWSHATVSSGGGSTPPFYG